MELKPYYIVYNPIVFNLMNYMDNCSDPLDLISILTCQESIKLNEENYMDFLELDLSKQRIGLMEILGIECHSMIYIANQIAKVSPDSPVILCDGIRRTIKETITSQGRKPKAIFVTTISCNFPTAVAVAIPLNYARIPLIIGGIHISTSPNDVDLYIRNYVPNPKLVSIVRGAGDSRVIKQIVQHLDINCLRPQYSGDETIEDGVWGKENVVHMESIKINSLSKIPIFGKLIARYYHINSITPYSGCPYSCNFCSISTLPINKRLFKTRTPDDFIAEIKHHQKKRGGLQSKIYLFLPDNLLLGKDTLERILDRIIESNMAINFAAQVSVDIAKHRNLLKKLRSAGCIQLFVGFESLDIRNLEYVGKHIVREINHSNLSVRKYYSNQISIIQSHGIAVHGAFIFGLPYDYFNSFEDNTAEEVISFCIENHIGIQPACLTDLPGSKNFECSAKSGQLLYGEPGTMNYLLSMSVMDCSEVNRALQMSLNNSRLLPSLMAYESAQRIGSIRNAIRNAVYMIKKNWRYSNRNKSFREKICELFIIFVNQVVISLYREGSQALAFSKNGVIGTMERLYESDKSQFVQELCKEWVSKFKYSKH